jgi:HEAT repeat protein
MNMRQAGLLFFVLSCCATANAADEDTRTLIDRFTDAQYDWQRPDVADDIASQLRVVDLKPLESWLSDPSRHRRGSAAYLFAKVGDPRGFATILGILSDRSDIRSIEPIIAVGPADSSRSPQMIAQQITQDRYYAVHLLGRLKDKRSVAILLAVLDDPDIGYNVAWALGQIGDARAIPPLIGALSNKDPLVRVSALQALQALHAKQALPAIEALYSDEAIPNAGDRMPVGAVARTAADAIRNRR